MDSKHPESEVPEPRSGRTQEQQGEPDVAALDFFGSPSDTEPSPPPVGSGLQVPELEDRDRKTVPPGSDAIEDEAHQELVKTLEAGISKRLDPLIGRVDALCTLVHRVLDQALDVTEIRRELIALRARVEWLESKVSPMRPQPPEGNGALQG